MAITDIAQSEAPIAAHRPVIDTHHHFWGEGHSGAAKFGVFLPEDFIATVSQSGHSLAASVYVDCGWAFRKNGPEHLRCVGETEYADAVATRFASAPALVGKLCAGIVGRADLMLGDAVTEVLEAHLEASPNHFRGIRELVAYDPDAYQALSIPPGKTLDPRFKAGFARLAPLKLSCDLLCTHTMLADVADLARTFPETSIILNHLAGPIGIGRFADKRAEVLADWRGKIVDLAQFPNVFMKLSGMGSDVMGLGWQHGKSSPDSGTVAAAIRPYIDTAIDAFSPARCMFGSNFPVDRQSFSYGVMWNAFKLATAGHSVDDQSQMVFGTAARVYRLAI
ncbi:amidohydrolase family protein [Sphingobium sp. CECT 9361]|uniref:amidohydrolase family protein n=1 Tax=Sphingobium sp. CECT 9361 TaxID=2845384 RepID=UPI001E439453|nr:amidohydrolase family protein [Sphingobium sp. CECT 9361]CAH0357038.1 hypothetical protein SPH9361_04687 [Sphingobium sp. CECT 9361]